MPVSIYKNDIPENLDLGNEIAVDTETMGLKFARDRLCLVPQNYLQNLIMQKR